jgi:hypothetical protein
MSQALARPRICHISIGKSATVQTHGGRPMSDVREMSFVEAMRDYFGMLPGESNLLFFQEIKALSDAERAWFKENLVKVGYKVVAKV